MSEKEWLSAQMDDQVTESGSPSSWHDDDTAHWANYHLIGDVMRQERTLVSHTDFADRFAAALALEAAHEPLEAPQTPVRLSLIERLKAWCGALSWGQAVGQLAVAAGVSFLAISGVQFWSASPSVSHEGSSETPALSVLQTMPFMGVAAPVSLNTTPTVSDTERALREQRQRINALLQDYDLQLRLNTFDGRVESSQPVGAH